MLYQTLLDQWSDFEASILKFEKDLGLETLNLHCDHAALRVNEWDRAVALEKAFSAHGKIVSSANINGRPILIIELDKPMTLGERKIPCVELPYPGAKQYPNEGWEHIELVLPSEATLAEELFEQLKQQISDFEQRLQGVKIKLSQPQAAGEQLPNPTIAFYRDAPCIKVHARDIREIIAS